MISKVGKELYEKFFRNYTRKQWGIDPSELDARVTARVPTRTNRDGRYFTDSYQAMPLHGYTRMFENMLSHENIKIMLNTDYHEIMDVIPFKKMIFTGPVDEYFDFRFGKLPYRSLRFDFETHNQKQYQSAPVINYPNDYAYTRVTEFKYLTGQETDKTTIVYEYPQDEGDPYYPVPRRKRGVVSQVCGAGRRNAERAFRRTARHLQVLQHGPGGRAGVDAVRQTDRQTAPRISGGAPTMAIELWAGIECTVNRVGDTYFDQLVRNGHERRIEDLDRFAGLGITAIRYPVLWERTAPNGFSRASWEWADRRVQRLAELGHSSHCRTGPPRERTAGYGFSRSGFPARLAEFAEAVARRYPWVSAYTPVNEPLTTARFSGLYGHWYPHRKDDRSFLRALVIQCRAVILSMEAIRGVNPSAQLVQTEDAGRTTAPALADQAEMENHRRLFSLDLLTGS